MKRSRKAEYVEPMKAKLVEAPPTHGDWIYEVKWDGFRTLALKDGPKARLFSRNENEFNRHFPGVAEAVSRLPCESAVIDGEVVALDDNGRPSFQMMQGVTEKGDPAAIVYYAFDLLMLDGEDLTQEPLVERKALLEKLLKGQKDPIRFSGSLEGEGPVLLEVMRENGLEGLIAKERNSRYEIGKRSGTWLKIKCVHEQEFVVGGFSAPKGTRTHFGALLVGYYEKGKLKFASKVGTGFDHHMLKSLSAKFKDSVVAECPFSDLPSPKGEAGGISASEMKVCTWVKPTLVCQVRFTEWTRDGHLRHPAFQGLRSDKDPTDVVREDS